MRTAIIAALAVALALPAAALAQEQQAAAAGPAAGPPVYDIVAADRETAWRINRVTGDVTICRIDTTGGLDSVRARCSPATMQAAGAEGGAQQSRAPATDGAR